MRRLTVMLALGCSDSGLYAGKTPHSDPLVSILTPAEGAAVSSLLVAEGSVASPGHDALELSVEWAVDGRSVCVEAVPDEDGFTTCNLELSADAATISLTVTDAMGARARDSVTVTVDIVVPETNAAPGAPEVTLVPTEPMSSDDLEALLVEAIDPDGDPVTHRWEWTRDGSVVDGLVDGVVSADETLRGEQWSVRVVASDGELEGPAATAGPVTIGKGIGNINDPRSLPDRPQKRPSSIASPLSGSRRLQPWLSSVAYDPTIHPADCH